MKLFVSSLLLFVSLNAFGGINESQQATSTAISAAQAAIGIAKAALISKCVTPKATTKCNETTSMIVTIAGDVLAGVGGAVIGGAGGAAAGGVVSTAMCLAIRCDTNETAISSCGETCSMKCKKNNVNAIACLECEMACATDASTDMAVTDPDATVATEEGYKSCIDGIKGDARKQQIKCQKICGGMSLAMATLSTLSAVVKPEQDKIKEQTSSDGGGAAYNSNTNTNTNNNNHHSNNNNFVPAPDGRPNTDTLDTPVGNSTSDPNLSAESAYSSAAGDEASSGVGAGSSAGTSSLSASSRGGSDADGSKSTAGGSGAASSFAGGTNSTSSDSSRSGAKAKSKLQGLDNKKATADGSGEYLEASKDLFIQVSAILGANYIEGDVGNVIKIDANKKNVNKKDVSKKKRGR